MKHVIFFTFIIITWLHVSAQTEIDEKLNQQIENAKDNFRSKGLNNLDKIEGVYHFKVVVVTSGLEADLATLNGTKTYYSYAIINRSNSDANRFNIWEYSEHYGNKFLQRTTNWFIRKDGDRYFVSCSDCSKSDNSSIYHDSEVMITDNEISFTEKYSYKYSNLEGSTTYSTNLKIFPAALGKNIFKSGTGFFISQTGFIVTNYHVIENATNIYASNQVYNKMKAEVVYIDEFNDIAILKVNISLKTIPFNIISVNKEIGNSVFTLGFPYVQSMGSEVKLTNGIINSSSGYKNDTRYYQFSAEIQPGNSGGPLFDTDGNVVGLVSAKHSNATNVGYALKSKFILDFIKLNNPTLLKKNVNTLKNLTLSSKYKLLKNYVLLLEIE